MLYWKFVSHYFSFLHSTEDIDAVGYCDARAEIEYTYTLKENSECCSVVQMNGLQGDTDQ